LANIFAEIFRERHTIPQCDGRTVRRTDTWTDGRACLSIYKVAKLALQHAAKSYNCSI